MLWDNGAKNLYRVGFEGMVSGFIVMLSEFKLCIIFCFKYLLFNSNFSNDHHVVSVLVIIGYSDFIPMSLHER